jgi:hypothetical protein
MGTLRVLAGSALRMRGDTTLVDNPLAAARNSHPKHSGNEVARLVELVCARVSLPP